MVRYQQRTKRAATMNLSLSSLFTRGTPRRITPKHVDVRSRILFLRFGREYRPIYIGAVPLPPGGGRSV